MRCVKEKELKKEFVMPVKANRKVTLSLEDKKRGTYEKSGLWNQNRTGWDEFTSSKWSSLYCWRSRSSRTRTAARVFCIC